MKFVKKICFSLLVSNAAAAVSLVDVLDILKIGIVFKKRLVYNALCRTKVLGIEE